MSTHYRPDGRSTDREDDSDLRPPLPAWILEAYAVVCARIDDCDDEPADDRSSGDEPVGDSRSPPSTTRERALSALLESDDLSLEPRDADHALSRLLERGYLYEVADELRVTDPDDVSRRRSGG